MNRFVLIAALLSTLLVGCAGAPPVAPQPRFDAAAAVAAIRVAGTADDSELVIRTLGDRQVEDLREQAASLQAMGRHVDSAAALDKALAISPNDPALMQERAEAALLLHDLDTAERLARHAIAIGAEVGPQCRRHWETVAQVLALRAPVAADTATARTTPAAVADARRQRDACTVAAPPRY